MDNDIFVTIKTKEDIAQLTPRERSIYEAGYEKGADRAWICGYILVAVAVIMGAIGCFNFHQ